MFSKLCTLMLVVLLNVQRSFLQEEGDEYVKISSEIELVVWDLEDKCAENAKSYKYLLDGKPNGLQNMIDFELELGEYLREQSSNLVKFAETIPFDLQKNFTLLTKCGNYLLPADDWKKLISFANKNEDLQHNEAAIFNGTQDNELHKSDYEEILQTSKNADELANIWSIWQHHISKYQAEYPDVLKLVNKAAKLNDVYNAKLYWEKLSDYDDLYTKVDGLWEEIEPMYRKLHNFVGRRLNHHYNTNYTDFIPAYLLGTNQGDDWSNIADIILPHPQLLYDINHNLLQKDIIEVYKLAENATVTLNLGKLSKDFWKQSNFNTKDCESHILTFCNKKMSKLLTCPNVTWPLYLTSHINALHLTTDRLDYSAYMHVLRDPSAITEAVLAMGDVFALANLERYGLLAGGTFNVDGVDEMQSNKGRVNRMNALLLLALRVLPRLAYSYGVDVWRLGELVEGDEGEVERNYWEIRKKFAGIEGITNEEPNFLSDVNILRNKPHLNKFVGNILQFQILNHYQMDIFDDNSDIVKTIGGDSSTFISMLRERTSKNAANLLNYHYSIDEISVYPLKEFFTPLFEYLETIPIEQAKVIHKIRTTSTSTTTTTTPAVKKHEQKEDASLLLKDAPSPSPEKTAAVIPVKSVKTTAQVQSGAEASSNGHGEEKSADTGMIAVIVVIVTLSVCLVAALLWKKYKRKSRTNNRRFET